MLSRRPSLQHSYDFISEHDDAIARPPEDAPEEERAEFANALRVARERGDYSDILIAGKVPTRLVLRPIDAIAARRLMDDSHAGRIGVAELMALAFRLALDGVHGETIKHTTDERLGKLAAESTLTLFHDVVVNEVGSYAWLRAVAPPPKS